MRHVVRNWLFAWPVMAATAPALAAQVIGVSDGDTLTILEGVVSRKIRLANIDAPEKRQPFGTRSRLSLSALCFARPVSYQVQSTDRYGRLVATVDCGGIDAGRAQVARGMAWVYPKYNQDRQLPEVESAARDAALGLWADRQAVPPWEFRRQKRGSL